MQISEVELTCGSFEMNNGTVVFKHVQFFNFGEGLHAYMPSQVTMGCLTTTRTYRISSELK